MERRSECSGLATQAARAWLESAPAGTGGLRAAFLQVDSAQRSLDYGPPVDDISVRVKAFQFLGDQVQLHGDVLPWELLSRGFDLDGVRVPLVGLQGIFKPAVLPEIPLSIRTAAAVPGEPPPYDDRVDESGFLRYRYRGTDPGHRDNVALRLAMTRRTPLIYLFGVERGRYLPTWPVYVVGDDPRGLAFTVAVDDTATLAAPAPADDPSAEGRRRYVTGIAIRRLHQRSFRERVLAAYQHRCAVCRLRRVELLEAAHILPDGHPKGEAIVPNGLSLCVLHHTAFDRHVLGIRPDLQVELREDLLRDPDGPTLEHALRPFHGRQIEVPRSAALRPRPEFLEERYKMFRRTG